MPDAAEVVFSALHYRDECNGIPFADDRADPLNGIEQRRESFAPIIVEGLYLVIQVAGLEETLKFLNGMIKGEYYGSTHIIKKSP